MKVNMVRSDNVYADIMNAPADKKDDIYRYNLMMPFKKKWDCYNIPMKAQKPGGYDVIMASGMMGQLPPAKVDESRRKDIESLTADSLWSDCEKAINNSLERFIKQGISLPVDEYIFTVLLANEQSPYIIMSKGYCGDGGIPGYIMVWLTPNDFALDHLPAIFAHETNHNIRYQFIKWRNDVTLGEMLVSEGLAENFAVSLYGEDKAGPWVTSTDSEWLNEYIKPVIHDGLGVQGMSELNAYLYGDDMAALQGYAPVGMPYCAGYACGYHLIRYYLQKTGIDIEHATLLPAEDILAQVSDFWSIKTEW